ncbi:MAG: hypothetical protein J6U54_20760 [Clostridiales bacterium]|nr:hypothetical protein [Clostridiales bacterium]
MSKYDDILHLNRPQYPDHPPMSLHDRAAQFSPFAALVGYDAAVAETARLTDRRREMSEEEIVDLNDKLNELKKIKSSRPMVTVDYFIPDIRKEGGSYHTKKGNVRTIDEYNDMIVFVDGDKIAIGDTYSIIIEK